MRSALSLIICCASFLAAGGDAAMHPASAQPVRGTAMGTWQRMTATLTARTGDTTISFNHPFVIPGSERVDLDSVLLASPGDFSIDYSTGLLTIHWQAFRHFRDTLPHRLEATCRILPFDFRPVYRHREPRLKPDTLTGKVMTLASTKAAFSFDDLFGAGIQKSGTLVRGFSVGSNRDLSLNSGFRMQMSGNLSDDLQIVAALTDQNSPIQPEGTTTSLSQVDQVFVELRGKRLRGTLGDFSLNLKQGEFGGFTRKVQGVQAQLTGVAADSTTALASASVARGKFTTNDFAGADGVQGPYRLAGPGNERLIVIVAGSERVFVDGNRMIRGENADYTIDYAAAEVTFTPSRSITSASRITIDFEFSDRHYSRTILAGAAGTELTRGLTFSASVAREADNRDAPLDIALNDSDRAILTAAGSSQLKAVRPGVLIVGPGKGQYIPVDTVVRLSSGRDTSLTIYRYDPADTLNAVCQVSFSYVGSGLGDYNRIVAGEFIYVGPGGGSYLPVRLLPLPEEHFQTDFRLAGIVTGGLAVTGEYSLASYNRNTFSPDAGQGTTGSAGVAALTYSGDDISLGPMRLGGIRLNLRERFVGSRFVPLDRINPVDYYRDWNVRDNSSLDEESHEGELHLLPAAGVDIGFNAGALSRGEPFSSHRYGVSAAVSGSGMSLANYSLRRIVSRSSGEDQSGDWLRQQALIQLPAGMFIPRLRYAGELLLQRAVTADTLRGESFRRNEITPGVSIGQGGVAGLEADAGFTWEDSISSGLLRRSSLVFQQHYLGRVQEWHNVSTSLDLTLRRRTPQEGSPSTTERGASTNMLLRWQARANAPDRAVESDWLYEVSNGRTSRLEKIVQQVPVGTGNYIYAGDLNNNHRMDAPDFQLTRFDGNYVLLTVPSDALIPVTSVRTGARIRLNPGLYTDPRTTFGRILSAVTTETTARIEEESTDENTGDIYLLHLSHFLNDQTTLSGSNLITQDLSILESDPAFSARLRFNQRRGLTQYALAGERTYFRERSVRVRWQLVPEIGNELNCINTTDALAAGAGGTQARSVVSSVVRLEWSYRPVRDVEFGFRIGVGRAVNADTTTADLNDQLIRGVYSISGRGQLRMEFSREEATLTRSGVYIPYELTGGRLGGQTWLWNAGVEYQLTNFIRATLVYNGRSERGHSSAHTGTAEVRAFF